MWQKLVETFEGRATFFVAPPIDTAPMQNANECRPVTIQASNVRLHARSLAVYTGAQVPMELFYRQFKNLKPTITWSLVAINGIGAPVRALTHTCTHKRVCMHAGMHAPSHATTEACMDRWRWAVIGMVMTMLVVGLKASAATFLMVCVRACVRVCVHACVLACVRACVHACVRAWCVCTHVCVCRWHRVLPRLF